MSLTHWDPFRTFARFDAPVGAVLGNKAWSPATNIAEDESGYTLSFDVPGVAKENIDISVEDGVLSVSGERNVVSQDKDDVRHYKVESVSGRFRRSFRLPKDADTSAVTATYTDGVLAVKVARSKAAEATKITIGDA